MKTIPKTTIRKWLSNELRNNGHSSGCQYFYSTDKYNWVKPVDFPGQLPGTTVYVKVYRQYSFYDSYRFVVPDKIELSKETKKTGIISRDFQRSKVYAAERDMVRIFSAFESRLKLSEIESLAKEVMLDYGFDFVPKIIISKARTRTSCSNGFFGEIKLAAGWGQHKKVVLHELAHQIVYHSTYYDPGHGEYFVKIMVELYQKYLNWDRDVMLDILSNRGVKIAA